MRFVLPRFVIGQFVVLFIVMELLSVYCGFYYEIGRFKISKDDKNYLQNWEVNLMVGDIIFCWVGRIDNHKIWDCG